MITTFAGRIASPCMALVRRAPSQSIRRPKHIAMPVSWEWIVRVWWQAEHGAHLAWDTWQGVSVCPYGEVQALRHTILTWYSTPKSASEVMQRGLEPPAMIKIVELLLRDQRITLAEARTLETAMLAHVDAQGHWLP